MSSSNTTSRSTPGFRSGSGILNPNFEKFNPGHVVNIGSHKVEVVQYLAEGGFAQIYTVKFVELLNEFDVLSSDKTQSSDKRLSIGDVACLKRVKVNDETGLEEMKNEIDVMKQLGGSPNIVQYYDSNATKLPNGAAGYEIFLLMELCPNKSLLDFMNDRLATKLSVDEISKIMYDVTVGLAQMHYLAEPLIHRDIKIENVLVDKDNNFKLADFGSTSKVRDIAVSDQDIAVVAQDIFVHTTPQYRSPEMIDLYKLLPINETSDMWALGVFLYKLLFYTTPFEMAGQFAILHSKYTFPDNQYPQEFISLIAALLMENPHMRPNAYQVLEVICKYRQVDIPLHDRYNKGPYDFQTQVDYLNKTNDIRNRLLSIEQAHLQDQSKSNAVDPSLYNSLYTNLFEINPKINYVEQLNVKEVQERRKVSDTIQSDVERETNPRSLDAASNSVGKDSFYLRNLDESRMSNDSTYYPSMAEINNFSEAEFGPTQSIPQVASANANHQIPANTQDHGQNNFTMLPSIVTQSERNLGSFYPAAEDQISSATRPRSVVMNSTPLDYQQVPNDNTRKDPKSKTHKSNNPFPYINTDASAPDIVSPSNNYFNESSQQSRPIANGNQYTVASPTTYDVSSPTVANGLHPPPNLDNIFASTPNMNRMPSTKAPKRAESRGKQLFQNASIANMAGQTAVQHPQTQPQTQPRPQPQPQFQFVPQPSVEQSSKHTNKESLGVPGSNQARTNRNSLVVPDLIDFHASVPAPPRKEVVGYPPEDAAKNGNSLHNPAKPPHKHLDMSIDELSLTSGERPIERKLSSSRHNNNNSSTHRKSAYLEDDLGNGASPSEPRFARNKLLYQKNVDVDDGAGVDESDLMSEESLTNTRIPSIRRMIDEDLASQNSSESIDLNVSLEAQRQLNMSKLNSASTNASGSNSASRRISTSNASDIAPLKNFDVARNKSGIKATAGRHSLDLKYEEINFTRRNQQMRPLGSEGKYAGNATGALPQGSVTADGKPSLGMQNANGSTATIDSKTRPLSRVRQSLDIDRLRKEQLAGKSKSSKRSLFSMFK